MDRWTILDLKIRAADKQGKDPSRFEAERSALDDAIKNWKEILREETFHFEDWEEKIYNIGQQVNALSAVNALLWDAEDKIRTLPEAEEASSEEVLTLALLCKRIASLKDNRADLVRKISQLYGEEKEEMQEKIYGAKLSK